MKGEKHLPVSIPCILSPLGDERWSGYCGLGLSLVGVVPGHCARRYPELALFGRQMNTNYQPHPDST